MKHTVQPGPGLWGDPADPENRAGLTPRELLGGWRQPPLGFAVCRSCGKPLIQEGAGWLDESRQAGCYQRAVNRERYLWGRKGEPQAPYPAHWPEDQDDESTGGPERDLDDTGERP